ncbi:hypothetical protein [Winogradskyella marincola]|uniref:VWFA domain-containing protein n=1 Tax=Winogradskyella marincola TaxID=3037795 RepID=A0ABT6G3I7_9FLAO|nr:hypothetical protein [Winogradskyella sp. YYF002]MDG4716535.1 hypothetical protein [Winogradskyella sp. YYF002]
MKQYFLILISLLFINCSSEKKTIVNEHLNIIITPDLSNRIEDLYTKPILDTELITNIYKSYYPNLYKINNRVLGQKDVIQFRFTNPDIISKFHISIEKLKMDLSKMSPNTRINYLTKGGINQKVDTITKEVEDIYLKAKQHTTGGDIYNFLKKEISSAIIKKNTTIITTNGNKVKNLQRNIVVLLTDGYIEAGLYGKENCHSKKCYYLSKSKIDEFRSAFLKSGNPDLKSFFESSGYGIIPINNINLKNIELFVSEIYDRSLNRKTGSQTITPNDFEIIKLFWADWLEKSGIKHYKLLGTSNSKEEFMYELKTFIKKPISY